MSYRQCIQVFHSVDVEQYLRVLRDEFGALPNDEQAGTFLIGDPPLPFYAPQLVEDHLAIVSFNYRVLSPLLLTALVTHPELAPPSARVTWLDEQDLVVQGSVEGLGQMIAGKERH